MRMKRKDTKLLVENWRRLINEVSDMSSNTLFVTPENISQVLCDEINKILQGAGKGELRVSGDGSYHEKFTSIPVSRELIKRFSEKTLMDDHYHDAFDSDLDDYYRGGAPAELQIEIKQELPQYANAEFGDGMTFLVQSKDQNILKSFYIDLEPVDPYHFDVHLRDA